MEACCNDGIQHEGALCTVIIWSNDVAWPRDAVLNRIRKRRDTRSLGGPLRYLTFREGSIYRLKTYDGNGWQAGHLSAQLMGVIVFKSIKYHVAVRSKIRARAGTLGAGPSEKPRCDDGLTLCVRNLNFGHCSSLSLRNVRCTVQPARINYFRLRRQSASTFWASSANQGSHRHQMYVHIAKC